MRRGEVRCLSAGGFHRVAWVEWGPEHGERVLVCVHGVARNGRDFDVLAAHLAEEGWRVVCPDVVGRGRSGHLADPKGYAMPQYLADMTVLLAALGAEQVDWLGTSMGGLIGLMMAVQADTPIRRLILNDIGPFVPKAALARIAGYVGRPDRFARWDEAAAYFRRIYAPWGNLSDLEWAHLVRHSFKELEGGGVTHHFDPAMAEGLRAAEPKDVDLWRLWDSLRRPTLVLRGEASDVLPAETAAQMTQRGPKPILLTFPDCGHAPSLMHRDQIAAVQGWLG
ncbi:MAG TPA: alpha/beta hydrolase [Kiloniellales bacterium]|nr:alpha/beta hydrolase [Kiloniellales bacterium]